MIFNKIDYINNDTIIIVYHNADLDGMFSGAIIKYWAEKFIKENNINLKIGFYGYDYGYDFNFDMINFNNVHCIMADISVDINTAKLIKNKCKSFVWIDHHKRIINEYKDNYDIFSNTYLSSENSACYNCWKYFFPDIDVPDIIEGISNYDIFKYYKTDKWNNEVYPFQLGAKSNISNVMGALSFIDMYFEYCNKNSDIYNNFIKSGKAIQLYLNTENLLLCKKYSYVKNIFIEKLNKTYKAIIMNGFNYSSLAFKDAYDKNEHDIMIMYNYNGDKNFWKISIYTEKEGIDCSLIAKSINSSGGGHMQAAGVQVDSFSDIEKLYQ